MRVGNQIVIVILSLIAGVLFIDDSGYCNWPIMSLIIFLYLEVVEWAAVSEKRRENR